MKITHEYCDCCGKQLTYQDADGYWNTTGIKLEDPIKIHSDIRTSSGSSGFRKEMQEETFCSSECFQKSVLEFVKAVGDARNQNGDKNWIEELLGSPVKPAWNLRP